MHKITLTIKDKSKLSFLLRLLKQFDFIEISKEEEQNKHDKDFFATAGMWKGREIDAAQLRKEAWTR